MSIFNVKNIHLTHLKASLKHMTSFEILSLEPRSKGYNLHLLANYSDQIQHPELRNTLPTHFEESLKRRTVFEILLPEYRNKG